MPGAGAVACGGVVAAPAPAAAEQPAAAEPAAAESAAAVHLSNTQPAMGGVTAQSATAEPAAEPTTANAADAVEDRRRRGRRTLTCTEQLGRRCPADVDRCDRCICVRGTRAAVALSLTKVKMH